MSSVLKKRRKKMRKHKYKKLRRRQKFLNVVKARRQHRKGEEEPCPKARRFASASGL